MCYIRIPEKLAIMSLYDINELVPVTELEGVYCVTWNNKLSF